MVVTGSDGGVAAPVVAMDVDVDGVAEFGVGCRSRSSSEQLAHASTAAVAISHPRCAFAIACAAGCGGDLSARSP